MFQRFKMLVPRSWGLLFILAGLVAYTVDWVVWSLVAGTEVHLPIISLTVIVMSMAGYGAYRAFRFYPSYKLKYGKWLAAMPWDSSRPLPCAHRMG